MRAKIFLLLMLFTPGILGIPTPMETNDADDESTELMITDDALQANENSHFPNGIFVAANNDVFWVQPDGTRKKIGGRSWPGLRTLAFCKGHLFAISGFSLVNMTEDSYKDRSGDFHVCKTLTTVNNTMYTFDHRHILSKVVPNPWPTHKEVGNYRINPSIAAGIPPKHLFLVENGVYYKMDVQTGQGKKLAGKGNPSAAVYCYGYLFIIDINGDIWTINPDTGEDVYRITTYAKFLGSKGLACYQGNLWAVGKDQIMYEIDPTKLNKVTIKTTQRYTNTGPMTSSEEA